jgi:hypothetical protein
LSLPSPTKPIPESLPHHHPVAVFSPPTLSLQHLSVYNLSSKFSRNSEKKDLYVVIEISASSSSSPSPLWQYKTEIVSAVASETEWKNLAVNVPLSQLLPILSSSSASSASSLSMVLSLYQSFLAIDDKLVGFHSIPLSTFLSSTSSSSPSPALQSYSNVLYDSSNLVKRKINGNISFSYQLLSSSPVISARSPRTLEEEGSKMSIEASSLISKYVDPLALEENGSFVNGFSPSQLAHSAKILSAWESGGKEKEKEKATEKEPFIKTNGDQSKQTQQQHQPLFKEQISTKNKKDESREVPFSSRNIPIPVLPIHSSSSSPISTSRISNITTDDHVHHHHVPPPSNQQKQQQQQPSENEKRKERKSVLFNNRMNEKGERISSSSSSSHRQTPSNKKPSSSSSSSRSALSLSLSPSLPTIDYVFDQIFVFSFLKFVYHPIHQLTMNGKEFLILLDSLEIPIQQKYLSLLDKKEKEKEKESSSSYSFDEEKEMEKLKRDFISFPINHPSAFALAIRDLLISKYFYLLSLESEVGDRDEREEREEELSCFLSIYLTPIKCKQCLETLITLLTDNYENIRGIIFLACSGNAVMEKSITTGKKKAPSSASFSSSSRRPSQFSSSVLKSILLSMGFQGKASSSSSNETVVSSSSSTSLLPSSFMLNGREFLDISTVPSASSTTNERNRKAGNFASTSSSVTASIAFHSMKNSLFSSYSSSTSFVSSKERRSASSSSSSSPSTVSCSSILLHRCLIYQFALQILESLWDRGIRPNDKPLSSSASSGAAMVKEKEKAEIVKNLSYSFVERLKSRSMATDSSSVIPPPSVPSSSSSFLPSSGSKLSSSLPIGHSSSASVSSVEGIKNSLFLIVNSQVLLDAFSSLNRAYHWNYPISLLSSISNQTGGLYCRKLEKEEISRLTVKEFESFYDPSSFSSSTSVSKGKKSQNQRETEEKDIEDARRRKGMNGLNGDKELVWVSVLFPNVLFLKETLQIFDFLSKEYYSSSSSFSKKQKDDDDTPLLPPLYHLFEYHMATSLLSSASSVSMSMSNSVSSLLNENELFIHLPLSCLIKTSSSSSSKSRNLSLFATMYRNQSSKLSSSGRSPTSSHSSPFQILQDLYHLFYSINASSFASLSFEALKVGMKVRIVAFSLLQRLVNDQSGSTMAWFETEDQPNLSNLEKFANKACEIVSLPAAMVDPAVPDVEEKGRNARKTPQQRIGVKLLHTNLYEALPLEALLPYYPKEGEEREVADADASTIVKKKERKKSSSIVHHAMNNDHSASSEKPKHEEEEEAEETERIKEKIRKLRKKRKKEQKLRSAVTVDSADEKEEKKQQQGDRMDVPTLKSTSCDPSLLLVKEKTKMKTKSKSLQQQQPFSQDEVPLQNESSQPQSLLLPISAPLSSPFGFMPPSSGGDECFAPPVDQEKGESQPNSEEKAFRISIETKKSPKKKEKKDQKSQSQSVVPTSIEKDLSWLKPVSPSYHFWVLSADENDDKILKEQQHQQEQQLSEGNSKEKSRLSTSFPIKKEKTRSVVPVTTEQEERQISEKKAKKKTVDSSMKVENIEEEEGEGKVKEKDVETQIPMIHPMKQAEFDIGHAVYTTGFNRYPHPSSSSNTAETTKKPVVSRPKSASSTARVAKKTNEGGDTEENIRPKTAVSGSKLTTGFMLSGHGYTNEKKESIDDEEEFQQKPLAKDTALSPDKHPSSPPANLAISPSSSSPQQQQPKKYSTHRIVKNTQKYFDSQLKEKQEDIKHLLQNKLHLVDLGDLNVAGMNVPFVDQNDLMREAKSSREKERKKKERKEKRRKSEQQGTEEEIVKLKEEAELEARKIMNEILNIDGHEASSENENDTNRQEELSADKPMKFDITVQRSPPVSPSSKTKPNNMKRDGVKDQPRSGYHQSIKEAVLFEREKQRNLKETEKKENYLWKELKKLGIDTNMVGGLPTTAAAAEK